MGEQQLILKNHTDAAAFRRQVPARGHIVKHFAIKHNSPGSWPQRSGNEIQNRGLPAARGAEQGGDSRRAVECSIQLELGVKSATAGKRQISHGTTSNVR